MCLCVKLNQKKAFILRGPLSAKIRENQWTKPLQILLFHLFNDKL
jgi:hypothetical protein